MLELLSPKAEELWIESKDMIALHAVTRADRSGAENRCILNDS
jgi:hypothetical protein